LKIVICGLSITSSWGNGHATTYRALARALHARGHEIIFFERELEWYASNRDMPEPPFCRVYIYDRWEDVLPRLRRELNDSDVAVIGSFFSDGAKAIDIVLDSHASVKAFYDIDTPITVAKLRLGKCEYLHCDQISGFDLYFSFTGGPLLREIENRFGARRAVPLYCSFDPDRYRFCEADLRYKCDLSYMGTYAADRQAKLEELFFASARALPEKQFLLAGPQYPRGMALSKNVCRIIHLEPEFHPHFYCSSRFTLNLTRRDMVEAGYSPSVRLFEAAGCGAAIISDSWPGLSEFFTPGTEILMAGTTDEMVSHLNRYDDEEARAIGNRGQKRVLASHTAEKRAIEFEEFVGTKARLVTA
jgi:spore maturation protein CgeB